MIGLESQPRAREGILKQRVEDETILFHLEDGQYYALDEVGGRVWELCDGTRSVADVISVICREFEAPVETIEADVLELLGELASEKLVVAGA